MRIERILLGRAGHVKHIRSPTRLQLRSRLIKGRDATLISAPIHIKGSPDFDGKG